MNERHRYWLIASLQKRKEELVQMINVHRYQFAEGCSQYTIKNKTSFEKKNIKTFSWSRMTRRINHKAVRKFWAFMGEKTVLCNENAKKNWYDMNGVI